MDPISAFLLNNRRHREDDPSLVESSVPFSSDHSTKSTGRSPDHTLERPRRNNSSDFMVPDPPNPQNTGQRTMPAFESRAQSSNPTINIRSEHISKAINNASKLETDAYAYVNGKQITASRISEERGWDIFRMLPPQTDKAVNEARENTVFVSEKHVAKWVWAVLIALCAPELICFIRCFHRTMFRNVKRPTFFQFFIVLCVESLHAFGVGALVFDIFTNLPAVTAVMLSNALCLVPNILNLLSRRPNRWLFCLAMLDIGAIASQSTTYWAWPCFIYAFCLLYFITPRIPIENLFQSNIFGERLITIVAKDLNQTQINQFQARMHEFETPDYQLPDYEAIEKKKAKSKAKWNPDEDPDSIDVGDYVQEKEEPITSKSKHKKHVSKRSPRSKPEELEVIAAYNIYDDYVELNQFTTPYDAIWVMLFQIGAVALCYQSSKFACKVSPEHERLAKCEKLFVLSYYSGVFVDQSLSLNRRRDDKAKIKCENLELDSEDPSQTYETVNAFGRLAPPSLCSVSSSKLDGGLIRDSASSADAISKIYVCATMWHETAFEMKCMLKSIFRLDEDQCARRNAQKYLKFEAHIFLDDSFDTNEFGELEINKYVKQIIENMDGAASAVHQTPMRLKTPKMCTVPYGGRLSYILPGRNRLTIHLKVMYLYYLLGYRLMTKVSDQARKEIIAENTYILTLDGDVDFTPRCVHLLVDLMKKNRRLGAACGRIHPRGSGNTSNKATEHMIGCVLCSPGCFSLFRSYALMDDNVTRKYATKSEKPIHYVQYDQGEDRWLCTLLLQRGYRVEYCAASDALTFAPEGFNEFFNQRRRWIPSTLANIIDLIRDYRNVVAVNESISIWYIIYQFIMLVSSILGPGTIFLMVVGAISISFNIDTRLALLIVTFPVVLFCVCCLTCKTEKQLLLAQLFAALFAMLMTAVMVGTSLQIQKDGITSPHSIFLFAVIGSITNLNTASWGTREHVGEANEKKKVGPKRLDMVENGMADPDGELSFGCGSACRLMCCLKPNRAENSPQLWKISEGLKEISNRLERLETGVSDSGRTATKRKLDNTHASENSCEYLEDEENLSDFDDNYDLQRHSQSAAKRGQNWKKPSNETWLNDKLLKNRFERHCIDAEEESFWIDMIEKYLQPVAVDSKEQERIRVGLLELRNKMCSAFFMINVVFIIVVLVLQMQKDCLHIEWPLGPKFNHSITPCNSDSREEIWVMTRLQLEPIGLVFLVFFMSILIIQFVAMLLHRFATLAHIIASTDNAISRRKVVQTLECSRRSRMKNETETLDAAFKKRFFALSSAQWSDGQGSDKEKRLTLRRSTIKALEHRRNSVFGTMDRKNSSTADIDYRNGNRSARLNEMFHESQ
ncbi:chitin synthase domain-containing protein [Ditylenchus destructor]|nr:chitin synthase domain-containing protein [Ditylenchus destructor]